MGGLTFDTGALIAAERRKQRIMKVITSAERAGIIITVPAAVIAEWWRDDSRHAAGLLSAFKVEPLTEHLAKLAGKAIAAVPGATTVDAIVMASAALRGDLVYTSDYDDLSSLQVRFPAVRILGV